MKEQKNNKHLYKILNAQQLGLKLIANVTYGYTSANFSGRMPCIEVPIQRNNMFLCFIIKRVYERLGW
jgi:hypothetical protein